MPGHPSFKRMSGIVRFNSHAQVFVLRHPSFKCMSGMVRIVKEVPQALVAETAVQRFCSEAWGQGSGLDNHHEKTRREPGLPRRRPST